MPSCIPVRYSVQAIPTGFSSPHPIEKNAIQVEIELHFYTF